MPDINQITKELEPKIKEALDHLETEFRSLHTGRASTAILEDIMVSYYGTKTPLKQLANISVADPGNLAIEPYDKSSLGEIEKAIKESQMSLPVMNDGNFVRVALPPLSEERRRELTKVVRDKAEEVKVSIRQAREQIWERIQNMVKNKELTEDDKFRGQTDLNKKVEGANRQIEEKVKTKEQEILKV
ncbi:ribosome recycling factor [Patescibacteria group bacterium]|nr:ribosome recycling factor [Patescibacteria group bacterium]